MRQEGCRNCVEMINLNRNERVRCEYCEYESTIKCKGFAVRKRKCDHCSSEYRVCLVHDH